MSPAAITWEMRRTPTPTPRWALALAVCVTTFVCLSVLAAMSVVGESLARPGEISLTDCTRQHQAPRPPAAIDLGATLKRLRQAGLFSAPARLKLQHHMAARPSLRATLKRKPSLPTVNELLIQTNGYTRISGRCEPNRPIKILLDGKQTTTTRCASNGVYHTVLTDALTTGEHTLQTAHNIISSPGDSVSDIRIYIPPGYWDDEDRNFLLPADAPDGAANEPIPQDIVDYAEELSAAASRRFDEVIPADGPDNNAEAATGQSRTQNLSTTQQERSIARVTQQPRNGEPRRNQAKQEPQRVGTCPWVFAVTKATWNAVASWFRGAESAYMANVVPHLRGHDPSDPYETGSRLSWFLDVPLPERRDASRGFKPVNIDTADYVDRVQGWFARSYHQYRDEVVVALGGQQHIKRTTPRTVSTPKSDRLASRDQIATDTDKMEREAKRIARQQRETQQRERERARQQQIEKRRLAQLEQQRLAQLEQERKKQIAQSPVGQSDPTPTARTKPAQTNTKPTPTRQRSVEQPMAPPVAVNMPKTDSNAAKKPATFKLAEKAPVVVRPPTRRPITATGTARSIPLPAKRPRTAKPKKENPVRIVTRTRERSPSAAFDGRSSLGATGVVTQKPARKITRNIPLPAAKPRDIAVLYVKKRDRPHIVTSKKRKKARKTTRKKRVRKKKKKRRYTKTYVVRKGDSLWRIARRVYGRGELYTAIIRKNRGRLPNPDKIRPGLRLTIPKRRPK